LKKIQETEEEMEKMMTVGFIFLGMLLIVISIFGTIYDNTRKVGVCGEKREKSIVFAWMIAILNMSIVVWLIVAVGFRADIFGFPWLNWPFLILFVIFTGRSIYSIKIQGG
jgi:hypothetical protein